MDEYFVNLQRALTRSPSNLRSVKLKFERGHVRQNIIKLRCIVKDQIRYDKLRGQERERNQLRAQKRDNLTQIKTSEESEYEREPSEADPLRISTDMGSIVN